MRTRNIISAVAIVAITVALTGCKGRTMENVEPTGDTVEVVLDTDMDSSANDSAQTNSIMEVASDRN